MFVYDIYMHTIYIFLHIFVFNLREMLHSKDAPPLGSSVPDTNLAEAQRKAQEAGKIRIRKMRALSVSLADR